MGEHTGMSGEIYGSLVLPMYPKKSFKVNNFTKLKL